MKLPFKLSAKPKSNHRPPNDPPPPAVHTDFDDDLIARLFAPLPRRYAEQLYRAMASC